MPLATPTRRMPQAQVVGEFLSDLLGREVDVRDADELDLDERAVVSASLVDDEGDLAGAIVSDLAFAACTGASLIVMPASVATGAIAEGRLPESLRENYHEVANIMTALVNGPSVPHVRIAELLDGVPDSIRDVVLRSSGRRTYRASVPGYGDGDVAIYATSSRRRSSTETDGGVDVGVDGEAGS